MEQYKSHKIVKAAKIVDVRQTVEGSILLVLENGEEVTPSRRWWERQVLERHPTQMVGGYYVEYGDYQSWSPANKFEEGYTKVENNTPSLSASDKSAASVAKTPWCVSLDKMKERVAGVEYIYPKSIPHMTICIVILDNGYALQGMSAPADLQNFDEEKGREFAYEDALRKLWPLEAYVMRDYMTGKVDLPNADKRWTDNT